MAPEEKLSALLKKADVIIGFSPMGDEPDIHAFLAAEEKSATLSVSSDPSVSPLETAELFLKEYAGKNVVLFIPGVVFDTTGTRHGRGGGWYDRFLSKTPTWHRVGVLNPLCLEEKLVREKWDEPMDFLLILDNERYEVIETGARTYGTVLDNEPR